jgi:rRNA pseudouridine-1189 N-methylase Emg1 (Nep1/Mra1 family)
VVEVTTIQVTKPVLASLKEVRQYPRQSYNELIVVLVKLFKTVRKANQYDRFLHEVQRSKMTELWGNKEDEAWESA